MSWDAYLNYDECEHCGRGGRQRSWNFTHNTNGMIADVMEQAGEEVHKHFLVGACWFDVLNGMNGDEGGAFLKRIIDGLEADPAKFNAMNPANGWGSRDRLVEVLKDMQSASAAAGITGRWSASG